MLTECDTGRLDIDVLALAEVVEAQHAVGLVAFLNRDLLVFFVAKVELGLHVAADRLERARREHALGRATRSHHAVDAKARLEGRLERPGDITGGDELDARPDLANLCDGLLVT